MVTLLSFAASNAVTASLLAVFAAIITRFCRRPAVRHALWLLVLIKLLTPPLLPLSVPWLRCESTESLLDESPAFRLDPPSTEPMEAIALPDSARELLETTSTDPPAASFALADCAMPLLLTGWLGGAFAWWGIAVLRLRKFQRLLRLATPATAEVQAQTHRLSVLLRLRRCPPVVFVDAPLSPLLWALGFSPRLLLPLALWQRLDEEQRDTLLAHELAHLRRGDHWIRRLEFVVLGLYWWHPVVWWARRRLQEAEEECCDALVVSVLPASSSAYASALVETVSFLSQARTAALVGVSGAGQVPLLKRRLAMILTENRPHGPSRAAFWLVLGAGALLLPWSPAARTETPNEGERAKAPEQTKSEEGKNRAVGAGIRGLSDKQSCVACHTAQTVNPHDMHDKPATWQEAHREAMRLMDQYTLLLRKTDLRPPVPDGNRGDEIDKLQDEIELLRLQVRRKESRLRSAKALASLARKRLDQMKKLSSLQRGSIPTEAIDRLVAEAETAATDADVSEVELQEALLRLKQAERRLERLKRPAAKGVSDRAQQEKRLHELEQKVESLLLELRNLRRDMQ